MGDLKPKHIIKMTTSFGLNDKAIKIAIKEIFTPKRQGNSH